MTFVTRLILLTLIASFARAGDGPTAGDVFEDLKQLVGVWKVEDSDSTFRIRFETTANDTVLVEAWLSQGKTHSLTLYHLDADRLIATHYCPQGNQPRLAMRSSAGKDLIEFEYFDATNLKSIEQSHQHYLAFSISSEHDFVQRTERYRQAGEESEDTLHLVRDPLTKPADSAAVGNTSR